MQDLIEIYLKQRGWEDPRLLVLPMKNTLQSLPGAENAEECCQVVSHFRPHVSMRVIHNAMHLEVIMGDCRLVSIHAFCNICMASVNSMRQHDAWHVICRVVFSMNVNAARRVGFVDSIATNSVTTSISGLNVKAKVAALSLYGNTCQSQGVDLQWESKVISLDSHCQSTPLMTTPQCQCQQSHSLACARASELMPQR